MSLGTEEGVRAIRILPDTFLTTRIAAYRALGSLGDHNHPEGLLVDGLVGSSLVAKHSSAGSLNAGQPV